VPTAPRRPCSNAGFGCRELADPKGRGRCATCAYAYDRLRGTAQERGYDYRWSKYSASFRAAHPFCGDKDADAYQSTTSRCAREGRVTLATVTNHIRAHKGDPARFWDRRNHESTCKSCHDAVVNEGDFGR
jgi:5-methylcytosine-specific restriction enzyme A